MPARHATPIDLPRVSALVGEALGAPGGVVGSVLPTPLAGRALGRWSRFVPGMFGIGSRLRIFVEEYHGRLTSAAFVYSGRRPEWIVLMLGALPDPSGSEGAFRLLSGVSAAAARAGMHRIFGAAPDETRARETFFQAGFYSYTRETWFVLGRAAGEHVAREAARAVTSSDAHDLFRFYAATTPHAVQRAEQLTVQDFDVSRRAGGFEPPHLVSGNPMELRRSTAIVDGDDLRTRAFAVSFAGRDRHPSVCKVRTADVDVDLARELVRATARTLPAGHAITSPVRSYEEHVMRALQAEGFREIATSMLFVKELAIRVEERALAPAVVR